MSAGPKRLCVVMFACASKAVPWNLYVLCHCNARLADDVELVKGIMQAKASFIGQCLDVLYRERQPDEEESMPPANDDTCGGKARGKGTPLRVPQVGDENGPTWHKEGSYTYMYI